jgi:putative inorganic carbon (HCO3(-)) transporter
MPTAVRPVVWLAPVGVLLAALWPLTAYVASPLLMPAALALTALVVAVVRRPALGVASVLTLAPLQNLTVGSVRPLNFLIPAMTFALVAFLVLRPVERDRGPGFLLRPAALGMVGAGLLSSLLAIDPARSVNDMTVLLVAAALLFAVMEVGRRPEDVLLVVAGAVAGLALAAGHGLVQEITGDFHAFAAGQDRSSVGRIQGSFGHPNAYGSFLALLMPLAGALALTRGAGRSLRVLGGFALALAIPAVALSYSRGAIGAVVIGTLVWLALARPRAALLIAAVVAVLAATLAPAVVTQRFESSSSDVPLRHDIWNAAIDIYAQHPIVGAGLTNFSRAYESLPAVVPGGSQRRLLHETQVLVPPHAQNLYLNLLAEQGILGLAAFLVFAAALLAVLIAATRSRLPGTRPLAIGIGAGVLGFLLQSMLDALLYGEHALPLFALAGAAACMLRLARQGVPMVPG